jgi:PAS domain S-box-containing protein
MGSADDADWLRRRQEALLELTTDCDVVAGNFDAAVRMITETAVEIVDVDRVNVWLFNDAGCRIRRVDQFDRRTGAHQGGEELPVATYPEYFEALRSHRTIAAVDARNDDRTAGLTDYLAEHDIGSLLDATLRAEGEFVGVVCFEHVGPPREWTEDEIQFAGDVADVVHRALRNRQSAQHRNQLEFRQSVLEAQQEAFPYGILVVGDDGQVLSHNDRFSEFWGLSESLLDGGSREAVFEQIRPQIANPDAFDERIASRFEGGGRSRRGKLHLSDGRVVEWYLADVGSESGDRYGRLWTVRDVTDRKNRQADLERKNRAIDEAPIGVLLTDPSQDNNPIIYTNDRFRELTGYTSADAVGRNCRFLQGERTEAEPIAKMQAAIEAERPVTVELKNYRKDGSTFWNRVTIAPVEDDGEVVNYVGFQQDVTERKEATRQLKVLHRVLRHNLANQITMIRGYADQLAGEHDSAAASAIVQAADQLDDVTEKHRAIVRLLDDPPAVQPTDLDAALGRVVEDLREAHPDARLSVDRTTAGTVAAIPAVEDALRELVANAIVHGGTDAPTVDVEIESSDGTATVRISDDGPGIPAEEVRILRGEQEVTPLKHGVGMGLWLAYLVVTLSHGTIDVETSDATGTTIRVGLPLAE